MDLDKYSFIDKRAIFDASHLIEKKDDITCLQDTTAYSEAESSERAPV